MSIPITLECFVRAARLESPQLFIEKMTAILAVILSLAVKAKKRRIERFAASATGWGESFEHANATFAQRRNIAQGCQSAMSGGSNIP